MYISPITRSDRVIERDAGVNQQIKQDRPDESIEESVRESNGIPVDEALLNLPIVDIPIPGVVGELSQSELMKKLIELDEKINQEQNVRDFYDYNHQALKKNAPTYELERFKEKIILIFNHVDIDDFEKPRSGTENDVRELKRTFGRFGFKPIVREDCTKEQIRTELEKLSESIHEHHGCIIIAVLTHGVEGGYIYAKDGLYHEKDILKHFKAHNKPKLFTKPIVVIIQACRGDNSPKGVPVNVRIHKDGPSNNDYYHLPLESDILMIHSCFPGKPSYREHSGCVSAKSNGGKLENSAIGIEETDSANVTEDGIVSTKKGKSILNAVEGALLTNGFNPFNFSTKQCTISEDTKVEDEIVNDDNESPKPTGLGHGVDGTWFIQKLCKNINRLAGSQDLESIMVEVKRDVASIDFPEWNDKTSDVDYHKQMPVTTSTLIRKLYLRNYRETAPLIHSVQDDATNTAEYSYDECDSPVEDEMLINDSYACCYCFIDYFDYMKDCLRYDKFIKLNRTDIRAKYLERQARNMTSFNDQVSMTMTISEYLKSNSKRFHADFMYFYGPGESGRWFGPHMQSCLKNNHKNKSWKWLTWKQTLLPVWATVMACVAIGLIKKIV